MLSLTIGLFGTYFFVNIFGITNNIYVQVALIMLIGLLGKNGILIVEFARQRHEKGMSIVEAAIEGAVVRLRPILMTSFAFIFGMLPLIMKGGAGSAGNQSIGVAAAGGMLIGTLFGVFVIPTMYVIFGSLDAALRKKKTGVLKERR
jgi:HAE1 family hydrophobic/amphiphilic exporter-1